MKARIAGDLVAETFDDETAGMFHEDTVIVDVPDYLAPYILSPSLHYTDGAFTYDVDLFTADLKNMVANFRWINETGGVYVEGMPFSIPTTAEAQQKIAAILQQYSNGVLEDTDTVDFNVGPNTVTIGKDQITLINKCVARHVQASFTRQKDIYVEVDNWIAAKDDLETIFTLFNVEINTWPGNNYDQTGALATTTTTDSTTTPASGS